MSKRGTNSLRVAWVSPNFKEPILYKFYLIFKQMEISLNIKKNNSFSDRVACKESVTGNVQIETGLLIVIL